MLADSKSDKELNKNKVNEQSNQPLTQERKQKRKATKNNKNTNKTGDKTYGILIVEDEKTWRNIYKINFLRELKQTRKWELYEATNYKDAFRQIVQYGDRIDVVLLDLVLGEHQQDEKPEGLMLLETIVDNFGLDHIGIFILTAYSTKDIQDQCQLRGIRYFLDKSELDFDKIPQLINNYLDLIEKPKGKDLGFYIECRGRGEQHYLYVRQKTGIGNTQTDATLIGNAKEIKRIGLPNVKSNLDKVKGWQPED